MINVDKYESTSKFQLLFSSVQFDYRSLESYSADKFRATFRAT